MEINKIEKILSNKKELISATNKCRGDILKMTTLAKSGHPGGSLSTIDMLYTLYLVADIDPKNPYKADRDRVVVSNGHISPAVYSTLGNLGFFDIDEAIATFRLAGSIFEGHIERSVPGVEWTTGNLGQGLSAACGMAVAGRVKQIDYDIFVIMGDGEHQKGQISEARRFAVKYNLKNITVFIDYNKLQISGDISRVMPQNIKDEYVADGWVVLEIDGHNFDEILNAIKMSKSIDRPTMVLARTTMGKNVSFMENIADYHGKPLTEVQLDEALKELGIENNLQYYKDIRSKFVADVSKHTFHRDDFNIDTGMSKIYNIDASLDNRTAFGNAITDIVQLNEDKIAVFDCDLASSVKTDKVEKEFPKNFFQSGIQEHHTATMAGAASVNGVVGVFADFGVFGVDETYNQQRLNDINHTNLKVVTTHVGIDVGEDGRTHQCLDYVGAMRNLYGFKVIVPADPNQTDKAVRFAVKEYGNFLIAMGRSKTPVLSDENGKPFYGENYKFEYGKGDILRDGAIPLITYGAMTPYALKVRELLSGKIDMAVLVFSTPLAPDMELLKRYSGKGVVFVYEDHNRYTGLGAILSQKLCEEGAGVKVVAFGADYYPYSGKPADVLKLMGLDPLSVSDKIVQNLSK
ncbi:transketolase family protein [Calditerrivibrio sp.]|uniref:Transketolase n=1 Tax=Calditerrivibrio nitroreducens TaxID=477976 RepID=A0A2J6WKD0_9BACT|nr:MAG: transketolase [Calditerrivibrio nitroreducens]